MLCKIRYYVRYSELDLRIIAERKDDITDAWKKHFGC